MFIWYLNPTRIESVKAEVLAEGLASYFIRNGSSKKLVAIPKHMVVAKLHEAADDWIPSIVEYIANSPEPMSEADIDFSLADRVNTVH